MTYVLTLHSIRFSSIPLINFIIISDIYSLVYLLKSSTDYPVNSLTSIKFIMASDSVMVSDVMDNVITPTIENDEVELLLIASIQTLKEKIKGVAEMKYSSW